MRLPAVKDQINIEAHTSASTMLKDVLKTDFPGPYKEEIHATFHNTVQDDRFNLAGNTKLLVLF